MLNRYIDQVILLLDEDSVKYILDNDTSYIEAHHGFGRYVRNTLGLWDQNSDIVKWFKSEYALDHADDISSILVNGAFHALKGQPFDPVPQVRKYLEHWKNNP